MAVITAMSLALTLGGPITNFIASQNTDIFTAFSLFADQYTYIALPAFILVFYRKLGRRKVASLLLCMLLLYISVTYLKVFFHEPRPCDENLKSSCPVDYSFPSGHSAVAFAFAFFSVGTVAFPVYYVSAILIALSRIYLGVHTFTDIVGGTVVGIFSYFVSQRVIEACLRYIGG